MINMMDAKELVSQYKSERIENFEKNNSELVKIFSESISTSARNGKSETMIPVLIKHNGTSIESIERYFHYMGYDCEKINYAEVRDSSNYFPLYEHYDLKITW